MRLRISKSSAEQRLPQQLPDRQKSESRGFKQRGNPNCHKTEKTTSNEVSGFVWVVGKMASDTPLHEAPEAVELHGDSHHGRLSTFIGILKRSATSEGVPDWTGLLVLRILLPCGFHCLPNWLNLFRI